LRNLNNANVLAPSLLSIFVPFLAILSFHKRKKKFRRCLFKIARIHCYSWLATIKFGFFYFGTENKSAYLLQKVGTLFFLRKNTFFFNLKRKRKITQSFDIFGTNFDDEMIFFIKKVSALIF
jgi:hypothetical protein